MHLGVQVSTAGKIYEAIDRARELGCNTMQIFSQNPREWQAKHITPEDIQEFKKRLAKSKIKPLVIHLPYLANLATPKDSLFEDSVDVYVQNLLDADSLGADYLVTHMGSFRDSTESAGLKRLTQGLNTAVRLARPKVKLLLENTAGSGSWLGYKFLHYKIVWDNLKSRGNFGICLDTAHAFAAGYDLRTKDGLDEALDEIDRFVGLRNLKLIHLNDSKAALASRIDRHENIGKGYIGLLGMKLIVSHPELKKLPFILETPKREENDDIRNLRAVRKLL